MDLGEILRVMRSRWYIVVPMLLLAVGLGAGAFVLVPTTYSTYTMVSLLSSPAATKTATQGQDNPFLNFNGSLVATADFLGRRLQSTDVLQELKRDGVTEKYEVALAENAQGPFLTLTVTGTDREHLLTSAATLARYADEKLRQIQEQNGVASRDQIRLTQVIPPQKPQAELKKKLEVVIAATGGTVALTFVVTFVVESISRARRRRATAAAASADIDGTQPITAKGSTTVKSPGLVGTETVVLRPPPRPATTEPEPAQAGGPAVDSTAIIPLTLPGDRRRHPDTPAKPAAETPSRPVTGAPRVGSATTYQSKSADRRAQDANRVNGS